MASKRGAITMTLEDRLKASVKQVQPDVDLHPVAAPPPKEEEVIPDLASCIPNRAEALKAVRLAHELGELNRQYSALGKLKDRLSTQLKDIMGKNTVGKAICGEFRLSYFATSRTTLSEKLLLANNVSPLVIQKCKETKEIYQLRVSGIKEEEEG